MFFIQQYTEYDHVKGHDTYIWSVHRFILENNEYFGIVKNEQI